jgi:3-hydroxyisobutyrate dehydrogenase
LPYARENARAHGVSVIDAPVSGGGGAALQRRLLVMVGGDADVVERCRPVFGTYADTVVHLGELGSGQTTKLLNNLLFTANLGTAAASFSLAQSLGISPDRLTEVVARSSLPAWRGRCCKRMSGWSSTWRTMPRPMVVPCSMRPTPH